MTINVPEKKSTVGLRDLYVALVNQDDVDAYAAGTPESFAPAVTASHKLTSDTKMQFADDGVFDELTVEGETKVEMEVTAIPISMLALVLGKAFDAATGRMFDNTSIPPDVALSFRSKKSNGSYKYYQYLKGRFTTPDEEQATQADRVDPKTTKIIFAAIKTTHEFDLGGTEDEAVKRVVGDEDSDNFNGASWFSAVQVPVAGAPSALTCAPTPLNNAIAQIVTVAVLLTFNNPLAGGAEKGVALVKQSNNSAVSITRTLSANRKVLTLGHASLTAGTTFNIVLAGVTDMYGQVLADTVYNFATS